MVARIDAPSARGHAASPTGFRQQGSEITASLKALRGTGAWALPTATGDLDPAEGGRILLHRAKAATA